MSSLKKAAKSLSSNKVHPSNSQDADSEMADQPRRRRQSFSSSVVADESGSARATPVPRSSSPAPSSFRRRSLSNGSIGADTGSLAEQQDGRNTTRSISVEDDLQKKTQIKRSSEFLDGDFINPAPRKIAEHVQSLALQRFFSSAQKANSWSASSTKMIFGSDIDDSNLQNRAKLEARSLFFCKCLTFCACFSTLVACLTSRFEEDARNTMVTSIIQQGVLDCCTALNATLDAEGLCPANLEDESPACPPDNSLLVSYDTDFVVASNTTVYIQANAGRAFVSLLSIFNVVLLLIFYISKSQYKMLLDHLERNESLSRTKTVLFPEPATVAVFCLEAFILFAHLPPGDFESPVLVINSVFYGEHRVLKYPWVALSSLFCTLRMYTALRLTRDITLAKWSSKKKLLERQSGISINTAFALKVMMDESPVKVVGGSFLFIWILCSYWMVVFERNHPNIREYPDTIWLNFVTASTVGYGDLFPLTIAGRFVSVVAGIVGIIVAAFATAALCRNLALSNSEFKTKNLIGRGDMDRSISSSAATYIQRYFRFKWNRPAPDASFWNPAIDMLSAANEFTAAKREYDVWLKNQVNLIISLKRMLEESEIIMKFTNFLSNDTGESTKHFDLEKFGYDSFPQLEQAIRELRDYLQKMLNEAPSSAKKVAELSASNLRDSSLNKSRLEPSVDLSNFGNRIRSLAEVCKDSNTDLESACISVQRSGVGFVNPRAEKVQYQKVQPQSNQFHDERHLPFQQSHQQVTQHVMPPQQFAPQSFQSQLPPMFPDMSATTQAVMQIANVKLMHKLIDAIDRIGRSESEYSETDESELDGDIQPSGHRLPSQVTQNQQRGPNSHSSQRPSSAVYQRPSSALSERSFASSASHLASSRGPGKLPDTRVPNEQENQLPKSLTAGRETAVTARPQSASGFIASDEARSRGARYMQ